MNHHLEELLKQRKQLEVAQNDVLTLYYKEFAENNGKVSDKTLKARKKAEKDCRDFFKNNIKEINELIINENKKHNVYYDNSEWITQVIYGIKVDTTKTGQELVKEMIKAIKELNLNGVIVGECENGGYIRVFTPYKVYNYGFKRGYACTTTIEHNGCEVFYPQLVKNTQELNDKYINKNKERDYARI